MEVSFSPNSEDYTSMLEVCIYDKEMAMKSARDLYTRRQEGVGIWIVKAEDIVSSQPEDSESFFDPSNDKVYRHPTFYKLPDGAKHI